MNALLSSLREKRSAPVVVALSAMLLASACGFGVSADDEVAEVVDPMSVAPTVPLKGVVVGVVGLGILFQNHSPEELKHVRIVVNEGSPADEYRFETPSIASNTSRNYLARSFRRPDGTSLDPEAVDVRTMSVYATTPRGRGSWMGTYTAR